MDEMVSQALKDDPEVFEVKQKIPLSLAQGDLLERLFVRLTDHLNQADVQVIFDDLRHVLYDGLEAPSLKDLHTVTKNCRKCPHAKLDQHLPKWNVADPDCVFIVDYPFYNNEHIEFFIDSLVKSGFSSHRVTLTYVNRCPGVQPYNIEEIKNCIPYLFTELQILKPKLIVTMGSTPTSVLLGEAKLKDSHGMITWLGPWAIMPTYAPSYSLKAGDHMIKNFKTDLVTAYNFCYGVK